MKTEVLVWRYCDCVNKLENYVLLAVISGLANGKGVVVRQAPRWSNSRQQVVETVIQSCSRQRVDSDGVKSCWKRFRTDVGM